VHPQESERSDLDPDALKTLFRRYWSSAGWTQGEISASDFAYAKRAGVMFDPVDSTHDESVTRALANRDRVTPVTIADAFLASLSSRRLDWRSALGSYSAIVHLTSHSFTPAEGRKDCAICGAYQTSVRTDVSLLNFERLKWGGVRHAKPLYAGLDLGWFSSTRTPKRTEIDLNILRMIIDRVSLLGSDAGPGDAEKTIKSLFASNPAERRVVIQILGLAGVLSPMGLPTFWDGYPRCAERKQPSNKNDWSYHLGSHLSGQVDRADRNNVEVSRLYLVWHSR
jgi:hypothetical protein